MGGGGGWGRHFENNYIFQSLNKLISPQKVNTLNQNTGQPPHPLHIRTKVKRNFGSVYPEPGVQTGSGSHVTKTSSESDKIASFSSSVFRVFDMQILFNQ